MRKKTKKIYVGDVAVGGDSPISVQSMTTAKTSDIEKVVAQINALEEAGCDIARSAINSIEDAKAIVEIKKRTNIPLVADIQFDYKLALAAVEFSHFHTVGGVDSGGVAVAWVHQLLHWRHIANHAIVNKH